MIPLVGEATDVGADEQVVQVREVLGLEQVVVGQTDEELAEIIADRGPDLPSPSR